MVRTQLSPKEICKRGEEIYDSTLRGTLETPQNIRKILVIDIDSGDHEMGEDRTQLETYHRLHDRRPEGVFYFMRIGYPTMTKIGGGWGQRQP